MLVKSRIEFLQPQKVMADKHFFLNTHHCKIKITQHLKLVTLLKITGEFINNWCFHILSVPFLKIEFHCYFKF